MIKGYNNTSILHANSSDILIIDPGNETQNGADSLLIDYLPFDGIWVYNADSASPIKVTINNLKSFTVFPGGDRKFDEDKIVFVTVVNIGSSDIAANKIEVELQRQPGKLQPIR